MAVRSNRDLIMAMLETLPHLYRYRPLPKHASAYAQEIFSSDLNGFEDPQMPCRIDGILISTAFERVVVGDYGAYVEIHPDTVIAEFKMPAEQVWRIDEEYIERKGFTVKYHWYEFLGHKVYYQIDTVKYADYRPGYYYISVFDFDEE